VEDPFYSLCKIVISITTTIVIAITTNNYNYIHNYNNYDHKYTTLDTFKTIYTHNYTALIMPITIITILIAITISIAAAI